MVKLKNWENWEIGKIDEKVREGRGKLQVTGIGLIFLRGLRSSDFGLTSSISRLRSSDSGRCLPGRVVLLGCILRSGSVQCWYSLKASGTNSMFLISLGWQRLRR
jgi:hypothetical protein